MIVVYLFSNKLLIFLQFIVAALVFDRAARPAGMLTTRSWSYSLWLIVVGRLLPVTSSVLFHIYRIRNKAKCANADALYPNFLRR